MIPQTPARTRHLRAYAQIAAFTAAGFLMCVGAAHAADYYVLDDSPPRLREDSIARKLGRGLSNVTFGWLEIPRSVEKVEQEHSFMAAISYGAVRGTGMAARRMLAGVYEVMTFPLPGPEKFEPVVEPEFIFEDVS